jgi:hypothetical protein
VGFDFDKISWLLLCRKEVTAAREVRYDIKEGQRGETAIGSVSDVMYHVPTKALGSKHCHFFWLV